MGAKDRGLVGFQRAFRPRIQLVLLGILVLFALLIRVYKLGQFPDTVLGDEADNVQYAARILYGDPPPGGFFGVDWTPQPAFSIYKQALFIAIFGFNVAALRLPSAVISALALVPFYFLLRRQLSITASLLATALFATNVWYLNFSRSGWNNIDVCFYMLGAMAFLMLALDSLALPARQRRRTWAYFVAAGLFASLGLYAYPAGRAVTLAFIAFFPLGLWMHRRKRRLVAIGFLILFGVEAVTFTPQALYALQHWERFNGRTNVVLIFNQDTFKADPVGTLSAHLWKNLRGPWDGRVNNTPQYSPGGEPQLDSITGMLALAGVLITMLASRFRSAGLTWLWWLMLASGWFLTQFLTANTPNGARGIGYMPVLAYFAAVGLDALLRTLGWLAAAFSRRRGLGLSMEAACSALLLFVAASNVMHYVEWQSSPETRSQRYIYLTVEEFPRWAADIVDRSIYDRGITNLGEWRSEYPIEDRRFPNAGGQ